MSDRPVWASVVSAACLLRGLPLFFRAAPKTPLRALGIIALDTLHVLRHARPLPRRRINELAMFLDLEGCTNALWDHKGLCAAEYLALRQQLMNAGLGACLEAYLKRLRALESRRPSIGGDHRNFDEVRSYREAVARLSIDTAAAIALDAEDRETDTLFRILMQCQIIDDILDYPADLSAGLPSFLTAAASLPQAMELTARAARHYAASPEGSVLPLQVALGVVSAMARLVIAAAPHRHRQARRFSLDALERETHR